MVDISEKMKLGLIEYGKYGIGPLLTCRDAIERCEAEIDERQRSLNALKEQLTLRRHDYSVMLHGTVGVLQISGALPSSSVSLEDLVGLLDLEDLKDDPSMLDILIDVLMELNKE